MLHERKETHEVWDEQSICWNPEIQNPEEISTKDKLQKSAGNMFLKYGVVDFIRTLLSAVLVDLYGVVDRKRIWGIFEQRSTEMELMMNNAVIIIMESVLQVKKSMTP